MPPPLDAEQWKICKVKEAVYMMMTMMMKVVWTIYQNWAPDKVDAVLH